MKDKNEKPAAALLRKPILFAMAVLIAALLAILFFAIILQHGERTREAGAPLPSALEEEDNRNGNSSNLSFVTSDESNIYYTDFGEGGLRKVKWDLTGEITLDSAKAHFVEETREHIIYFSPKKSGGGYIMRIRKDGSDKERLFETDSEVTSMFLDEESVFFTEAKPNSGIFRLDIGGKSKQNILKERGSHDMVNMRGGKLFCRVDDSSGGAQRIMSVGLGGSGRRTLGAGASDSLIVFYLVEGKKIYFIDGESKLYVMDLGGESLKQIAPNLSVSRVNVYGGRIYCVASEANEPHEKLLSMDMNGGDKRVVSDNIMPGSPINATGGYVYYFAPSEGKEKPYSIFRVRAGRGKIEQVPSS